MRLGASASLEADLGSQGEGLAGYPVRLVEREASTAVWGGAAPHRELRGSTGAQRVRSSASVRVRGCLPNAAPVRGSRASGRRAR